MRYKILPTLAAALCAVILLVPIEAKPAAASDCVLSGNFTYSLTWVPDIPHNGGVNRGSCYQIQFEYSGSNYRFRLSVQDTLDICTDGDCNRDGGKALIQVSSPCSGCTNPWVTRVTDTNSADFVSVGYVSPWYNPIVNGPVSAWKFRFQGTTEFRNIIKQWISGSTYTGPVRTY